MAGAEGGMVTSATGQPGAIHEDVKEWARLTLSSPLSWEEKAKKKKGDELKHKFRTRIASVEANVERIQASILVRGDNYLSFFSTIAYDRLLQALSHPDLSIMKSVKVNRKKGGEQPATKVAKIFILPTSLQGMAGVARLNCFLEKGIGVKFEKVPEGHFGDAELHENEALFGDSDVTFWEKEIKAARRVGWQQAAKKWMAQLESKFGIKLIETQVKSETKSKEEKGVRNSSPLFPLFYIQPKLKPGDMLCWKGFHCAYPMKKKERGEKAEAVGGSRKGQEGEGPRRGKSAGRGGKIGTKQSTAKSGEGEEVKSEEVGAGEGQLPDPNLVTFLHYTRKSHFTHEELVELRERRLQGPFEFGGGDKRTRHEADEVEYGKTFESFLLYWRGLSPAQKGLFGDAPNRRGGEGERDLGTYEESGRVGGAKRKRSGEGDGENAKSSNDAYFWWEPLCCDPSSSLSLTSLSPPSSSHPAKAGEKRRKGENQERVERRQVKVDEAEVDDEKEHEEVKEKVLRANHDWLGRGELEKVDKSLRSAEAGWEQITQHGWCVVNTGHRQANFDRIVVDVLAYLKWHLRRGNVGGDDDEIEEEGKDGKKAEVRAEVKVKTKEKSSRNEEGEEQSSAHLLNRELHLDINDLSHPDWMVFSGRQADAKRILGHPFALSRRGKKTAQFGFSLWNGIGMVNLYTLPSMVEAQMCPSVIRFFSLSLSVPPREMLHVPERCRLKCFADKGIPTHSDRNLLPLPE